MKFPLHASRTYVVTTRRLVGVETMDFETSQLSDVCHVERGPFDRSNKCDLNFEKDERRYRKVVALSVDRNSTVFVVEQRRTDDTNDRNPS